MADYIETGFQAAIDAGKIHGAVFCARDIESGFVYDKAIGERTLLSGEKRPQLLDDVLFLASASKLVTSIAALQCVEDGLLTLTGDLSAVAPELATLQVITGFSDDETETPQLQPIIRPITLEMLLTHSSGLCYKSLNPHIARWCKKFAPPEEGSLRRVEEMLSFPLGFQPGTGWMYSTGLDWAGCVVERVTNRTLYEHMQQRIFNPLGITDAQFYPVTREDLHARLVNLNPEDPEAIGRAVLSDGNDLNKGTLGDFGGHGLFMSGPSYIKILHSLLASDGKLLKHATIYDMFQHHLSAEATASHKALLAGPVGKNYLMGLDPKTKVGHGLGGLITLQDIDGLYGEHTMTWGGGLTLTWFIDRKNGLCGVGAAQATLPLDGQEMDSLKQIFRQDIYRKYAAWKGQQELR